MLPEHDSLIIQEAKKNSSRSIFYEESSFPKTLNWDWEELSGLILSSVSPVCPDGEFEVPGASGIGEEELINPISHGFFVDDEIVDEWISEAREAPNVEDMTKEELKLWLNRYEEYLNASRSE